MGAVRVLQTTVGKHLRLEFRDLSVLVGIAKRHRIVEDDVLAGDHAMLMIEHDGNGDFGLALGVTAGRRFAQCLIEHTRGFVVFEFDFPARHFLINGPFVANAAAE